LASALARLVAGGWQRGLAAPWARIAREAEAERTAAGLLDGRLDPRVPVALVFTALVMVWNEYLGDRDTFARWFPDLSGHRDFELWSYAWWTGSKLVGYALAPVLLLRAIGVPRSTLHVDPASLRRHLPTYALLYVIVVPCVVLASGTKAFQATYPFYKLAARSWRDLLLWEAMYAASFIALELFYRGFLLGMLRRSLGPYAIFVMIVPYCMIHFGKPAAESVGAIVAGIALGTLAMATRSIWGGVLIHIAIAWTMDLAALLRTVGLPDASTAGRFVGGS
jgi:membrane protease YdiL (CAAX protease family)